MPAAAKPPSEDGMLINKLSVKDARHLLRCEGGELTLTELGLQLASSLFIAALTARAIVIGNATVWHLALPMVGEYLGLIAALPFLSLTAKHPELRSAAIKCLRLWVGYAAAIAIAVGFRSYFKNETFQDQFAADVHTVWRWIADAHMQWPLLFGFLSMVFQLPGRVRNLLEHGPPFVSVSLGCAMRLIIFMMGCFGLPWAFTSSTRAVWFLWGLILVAEVGALWMHWDIQRRLRKIDGPGRDPRALYQNPPDN